MAAAPRLASSIKKKETVFLYVFLARMEVKKKIMVYQLA